MIRNNTHHSKKTVFSSDCKYFACVDGDDNLLIWETANNVFIDCKFDSINNTCHSLQWISQNVHGCPKKIKASKNRYPDNNLLAVGTVKGDILIYNVSSKNLYLHLVGRHSDAVNDMHYYQESNLFFTCSSDTHIGIWDINTGREVLKWKAAPDPVYSICVLDDKNMLSSSTVVNWWNIPQKTVIKTFSGHTTEIFKLLHVNAASPSLCYFMSAANNDLRIHAWSLTEKACDSPVASFILPVEPKDIDISKHSSKNKPLILSAVTKDGFLHLFEHTLNGNINHPIYPNVSTSINPDLSESSFISTKLSPDSEFCLIAYGSNKLNVTFKKIKIKDLLKKTEAENVDSNNSASPKLPVTNDASKAGKKYSVNGIKASIPDNSPRVPHLNSVVSLANSSRKRLRSSNISLAPETTELCSKNVNLSDPKSCVDSLLRALEERNDIMIEAVLHNSDTKFISDFISYLPSSSLKYILDELSLRFENKYNPALNKWLGEILRVHLRYLTQHQDTANSLNQIKKYINSINISSTVHKITAVNECLRKLIQNSSDERNSENEESMES